MAFYAKHFLELRDRLIIQPQHTFHHWMHALHIPLGQFRVGSHRLRQRWTTRLIDQTESTKYVIYRKQRLRCTSFLDALSTMRSEEGSIACSKTLRPSQTFSGILIRDVWPYICKRLSGSRQIFLNLPSDQTHTEDHDIFQGTTFSQWHKENE